MQLPQRAQRRVAPPVLAGLRRRIGRRLLLMEPVEEGGTGEQYPHRRMEIAAGTELCRVYERSERRTGQAVDHAVALRRDLDDDARADRRGTGFGQFDVPVAVGLVEPQAPNPADDGEHAVLAAHPRGAPVLAREAQGRPIRQDRGDVYGCGRPRLQRGVDLLAPAIVRLGARLPLPRGRHEEQPTHAGHDKAHHEVSFHCQHQGNHAPLTPGASPGVHGTCMRRGRRCARSSSGVCTKVSSAREGVPVWGSRAVARALARDPAERYATAAQLAAALIAPEPGSPAQREPHTEKSIAVLPFTNMSSDPEIEYFGDGIAEEIINALARLPGLRVAGRSSAFSFKGKHEDLRVIGDKLAVASVLEGSVRKAGAQLRITAQLVNVADGYDLWSERFDRGPEDVFAIQEEIARTIADRLQVSLTGSAERTLLRPHTENLEAYHLYLKGRGFLYKRGVAIWHALEAFRAALELDPEYALASAGLADAYTLLGMYGVLRPPNARPQARAAARRSVELGPELAEAHNAVAGVRVWDWDWVGADRELREALELNPSYVQARCWHGIVNLQWVHGRDEEGVAEAARAVEMEPLAAYPRSMFALALSGSRRHHEAVDQARRAVALDPDAYLSQIEIGRAHV